MPELLLGDDKDAVLKGVKDSVVDKNIICDYESDLELNSIEKEKKLTQNFFYKNKDSQQV